MAIKQDYAGMSDLERDIELEMDDEFEFEQEGDEESSFDQEASDDQELEALAADDETLDQEADDESGFLQETDDSEFEVESDARVRDQEYVERFMEIASRTYESESEVDQALNETLDGLAQERLFGTLRKGWRALKKNKVLGALAKKGLSLASGQFPALKAALSLAKGDLKGTLMNLGKQAITAAIPGSGAALGALNSLGFTQSESAEDNREAWENYVQMSGEAFEHLAANLTPRADQPVEANRLATTAFQHAMKRAQQRTMSGGQRPMNGLKPRDMMRSGGRRRAARITVKPGQVVVLRNARTVVVKG